MKSPLSKVAPLLFCSGLCALLYQTAWLRELRLVFGASTAASAAVLAIFMGGLGAGGLILGRRVDRRRDPLMLYAHLELGVGALSAITPPLIGLVRRLYAALGGTVALGLGAGSAVRLMLAALVLLPPTVLMGGTLPAAAKAVETDDDFGRRNVAVLYGLNTLGAVTGAALSTFVLLDVFGADLTLWMACAFNMLVGMFARVLARSATQEAPAVLDAAPAASTPPPARALRPRGVGHRRLRLPAHGARLVPDARPAARRLVVHVRAHPRARPAGRGARRRRVRGVVREAPGYPLRALVHLRLRGAFPGAPLRARRPARGDRARAPAARLARLRVPGPRLVGRRRHRGRPCGLRLRRAVPPAHRVARSGLARGGRARRPRLCVEHRRRDRGVARGGLRPAPCPHGPGRVARGRRPARDARGHRDGAGSRADAGSNGPTDRRVRARARAPRERRPHGGVEAQRDRRGSRRAHGAGRVAERRGELATHDAPDDRVGGRRRREQRRGAHPGRRRFRGQRQDRRPRVRGRGHAGDERLAGRAAAPRAQARARGRPRHREQRGVVRRRALDRPRRRGGARAGDPAGRAGRRRGQPVGARQPQGARDDRRRPRGSPHHARALRHHLLGALEPLPRRRREPVHAGVLCVGGGAARPGRGLPPVAAGVRGRRADGAHRLRDARLGVPRCGDLDAPVR